MAGSARRQLKMFRRLCGKDAQRNVLLVTTMWDRVHPDEGSGREEQLRTDQSFWAGMIQRGSRILRHTGDEDSALKIVRALLPQDKVTLQIQRELVDEGKTLADTAAGALLFEDLPRAADDMAEAMQANDKGLQRELQIYEAEGRERIQNAKFIAVMGVTGAGKSNFIRLACGDEKIEVGHDLNSCKLFVQPPYEH
jgi:hypothetical protein